MLTMSLHQAKKALQLASNPEKAIFHQRFFKTGKGEYAEGDRFIGVIVPKIREIAKAHAGLKLSELQKLIQSKIHEERLLALIILVQKNKSAEESDQTLYFRFYLKNLKHINNWDLIDGSADPILGKYLYERDKKLIFKLARSKNFWERRIAIMTTFYFIKREDFTYTLQVARILLRDTHDLIHKAVGWMLREIGERDLKTEERFLKKYYSKMPRTMLRYAIEKFPEKKRKAYLTGKI